MPKATAPIRTCEHAACGASIEHLAAQGRFCGDTCRKAAKRAEAKLVTDLDRRVALARTERDIRNLIEKLIAERCTVWVGSSKDGYALAALEAALSELWSKHRAAVIAKGYMFDAFRGRSGPSVTSTTVRATKTWKAGKRKRISSNYEDEDGLVHDRHGDLVGASA
jgi:hypothetical protein